VVDGVTEAIRNSGAKTVYICNLMTKLGQTMGMNASQHVAEITSYIGSQPDFVLINSGELPEELLERYLEDEEFPVVFESIIPGSKVIVENLLANEEVKTAKGDVLKRSLIRHDSRKLARKIMDIATASR
jgi:uncharacterized cofD-like protein